MNTILIAAAILFAASVTSTAPLKRAQIVPRVDHHQHLTGPAAVIRPPAELPAVQLPEELERLLREHSRFTDDVQVIESGEEGQPWVRRAPAAMPAEVRFVPNAFSIDGAAGWIAGIVRARGDRATHHFTVGLKKDGAGAWRIASEQISKIEKYQFAEPITAAQLVDHLDIAGIDRAVVLSVAYWFGSPNRTWPGDEYANVRAENDWTAAQTAQFPNRLIPFCGVSPLREYAVREVRRCATELGMKGLKLHFRSSRVDVMNPEHLAQVREVFRTANELGMAIVVHTRPTGSQQYTREHAEVFLRELLPAAPDVVVQLAHLWGGNEFSPIPLGVFADAVAAGDPRTKNLYFDLTEVEVVAGHSPEAMQEVAKRLRQIGLSRILYGSDATTARGTGGDLPPILRWARLRHRLPVTDEEIAVIAGNVAPYLK